MYNVATTNYNGKEIKQKQKLIFGFFTTTEEK